MFLLSFFLPSVAPGTRYHCTTACFDPFFFIPLTLFTPNNEHYFPSRSVFYAFRLFFLVIAGYLTSINTTLALFVVSCNRHVFLFFIMLVHIVLSNIFELKQLKHCCDRARDE